MSSPLVSTWSATEPMSLSLNARTKDLAPESRTRIPSSAQRYYMQPRLGSICGSEVSSSLHKKVNLSEQDDIPKGGQNLGLEDEGKPDGRAETTVPKPSKASKRARSLSVPPHSSMIHIPARQSPRLVKKRAAALERMLRERVSGNFAPIPIKSRKNARRRSVDLVLNDLPALSEDPASYNSNTRDCRFHLPTTIEDRLAIRAAMTPTMFQLQKKGGEGSVMWNPDASYMEAHQKCLREYYKFEMVQEADSSSSEFLVVLTLLPWYGNISDFRNSPNWPEGW